MNKLFTKEVKIAIVAILGVAALFVGMNFLKGLNVFSSTTTYRLAFADIKGLSKSTPVYADGYKVGTITDIDYNYKQGGDILVSASLDPDLRIPFGSQAEIESDLMGNIKVNLLLANNPRQRLEAGDIIQGVSGSGLMGEMATMLPTVKAILPKLDSIMGSINTLLADPALAATLHNAQATTANLTQASAQLNTLMRQLNGGVPQLMGRADNVLANTETLTANLSQLDLQGTMAQVNATLDGVQQLTTAINSNEGSLGLLMRDPSVYNNLNATLANADSLMVDLKQHPKRYVHFSVFGKKDK